jgi:hypothetical protein
MVVWQILRLYVCYSRVSNSAREFKSERFFSQNVGPSRKNRLLLDLVSGKEEFEIVKFIDMDKMHIAVPENCENWIRESWSATFVFFKTHRISRIRQSSIRQMIWQ